MSILIIDGFDTYDNAELGLPNDTSQQGWQSTAPNNSTVTVGAAPTTGKMMTLYAVGLNSTTKAYSTAMKKFTSVSDLFFGVSLTRGSFSGEIDGKDIITLGDDGNVDKISVYLDTVSDVLVMKSDPATTEVVSSTPLAADTTVYVEIQIVAGVASLFINNTLVGSLDTGLPAQTYDRLEFICPHQTPASTNNARWHVDHLYLLDDSGAEFNSRLGPISIIPLIPTADGAVGSDFVATPGGAKYLNVDDNAAGGDTDPASYIEASSEDDLQTFTCTSEIAFTSALGYFSSVSGHSPTPSGFKLEAIAVESSGANEISMGEIPTVIGQRQSQFSEVKTALPGGLALTRANLEATEFGYRLTKPITGGI